MKRIGILYVIVMMASLMLMIGRWKTFQCSNDDLQMVQTGAVKNDEALTWPIMPVESIDNTTSFNSTYIMFCGPDQSSTLLSEVFLSALSLKIPKVKRGRDWTCPPEFFNPSCTNPANKDIMAQCFGSENYKMQVWQTCEKETSFANVLQALKEDGAGFVKENFGTWQMLDFHRKGYPVFVAHRLPQHTFPIKRKITRNYWTAIWRSFLNADPQEFLLKFPAGDRLVQLQEYAKAVSPNLIGFQPECLAHYIHFWHLLTIAIENGIPHVQIEKILLAEEQNDIITEFINAGICRADRISEYYCSRLAQEVYTMRNKITMSHDSKTENIHQINITQRLSVNLYELKEQNFEAEGTCRSALVDIFEFCSEHVKGCEVVNKEYNIDYFIS